MQIQVLYFAIFRERLDSDGETIELPDGADVAAALEHLATKHDPVRALMGKFQAAVNMTMVPADTALSDGDELALIPPVAGGTDDDRLLRIVETPPSVDRCIAAVTSPDMGGLVTFIGVVRRHNDGREVTSLQYEAYADMANKALAEVCAEIEADVDGARLAVEHRVGTLEVGDIAVAIAAAAPHRAEAFIACRAMIDRLKTRVPIWKKEFGPDGSQWLDK